MFQGKEKKEYYEHGVMHMVMHKFGDWEIETRHMSRVERSIYFDMRTIYLKTGESLTSDIDLLSRRLSCNSEIEKEALAFVLKDKFKLDKRTKRYKHPEWEVILKNYKADKAKEELRKNGKTVTSGHEDVTTQNNDVTNHVTMTDAERKAKSRQEARNIKDKLTSLGVDIKGITRITELRALLEKHSVSDKSDVNDADVTNDVTDSHNESHEVVTQKDAITSNQEPVTSNQEPVTSNQEPVTSNQEPVTKDINTQHWRDERFEEFYQAYPHKKSKGQAEDTWNKVFVGTSKGARIKHKKPSDPQALFDRIMQAVELQTPEILSNEERYRKHPSTWLNAKSWEDEPAIQTAPSHDRLAVNSSYNVNEPTEEELQALRDSAEYFSYEENSTMPKLPKAVEFDSPQLVAMGGFDSE